MLTMRLYGERPTLVPGQQSEIDVQVGTPGLGKGTFAAIECCTLLGHQGPVRALALASDQSFLVSAGNDGTLRIWRAPEVP